MMKKLLIALAMVMWTASHVVAGERNEDVISVTPLVTSVTNPLISCYLPCEHLQRQIKEYELVLKDADGNLTTQRQAQRPTWVASQKFLPAQIWKPSEQTLDSKS